MSANFPAQHKTGSKAAGLVISIPSWKEKEITAFLQFDDLIFDRHRLFRRSTAGPRFLMH
ncbi:MAG: hypothetical protein JWO91_3221 [Acidobacteriaceae bacterium]|nr:hypothetical protein [Acidobacteriaceae bacterium]